MAQQESNRKSEPMNKEQFLRIKAGFERSGGKIVSSPDDDKFLAFSGAVAWTVDAKTIVVKSGEIPNASTMFEELIHSSQYRNGKISTATVWENEIEAKEKLVKYQTVYGIPEEENEETLNQIEQLKAILEKRKKEGW